MVWPYYEPYPEDEEYYDEDDPLNWAGIAASMQQQQPLFPGSQQPFYDSMAPMSMGFDMNKYGEMEPYEQADMNQQLTGIKNTFGMLYDPRVAHFNSVMNGADTFGYDQMLPGGEIGMGGMPGMGGGGGNRYMPGGGGGGGYGGGTGAVVGTPQLTSAMQSSNPLISDYAKRIMAGEDPTTLQMEAFDTDLPAEQLDVLNKSIFGMWQEKNAADQAGMAAPGQSQLGGIVGKWGGIDPLSDYSADYLPSDVEAGLASDTYNGGGVQEMKLQAALDRLKPSAAYGYYSKPDASAVGESAVEDRGTNRSRLGPQNRALPMDPEDVPELISGPQGRALPGMSKNAPSLVSGPQGRSLTASTPEAIARETRNREEGRQAGSTPGRKWSAQDIMARGNPGYAPGQGPPKADKRYRWTDDRNRVMQGNEAAFKYRNLEQSLQRQREVNSEASSGARAAAAYMMQKQGRTPQKDAMSAQLRLLRSMGLGI